MFVNVCVYFPLIYFFLILIDIGHCLDISDQHVVITESMNDNNIDANKINDEDEDTNHIIRITDDNYSHNAWEHSVLFLLFYTDWCYYSQELLPIYSKVATKVHRKLKKLKQSPDATDHIKNFTMGFGIVDGDIERDIMGRFHVSKYPTIKQVFWGRLSWHEYRGARSLKAMTKHAMSYVNENVIEMYEKDVHFLHDKITDINSKPIIAVFSKDDPDDNQFYKESLIRYSITLKDDCDFYWITLNKSNVNVIDPNTFNDTLYFHPHVHTFIEPNSTFEGDVNNLRQVRRWISDKCNPLVTEITFENAEEITELGEPMLVLFINPDHDNVQSLLANFIHAVYSELDTDEDPSNVVAHYANGLVFNYALKRVGKDPKTDLPLLVLDNFVHIFTFDGNISDIGKVSGTLKAFVDDFNSGHLHDDYHNIVVDKVIADAKDGNDSISDNEVNDEEAKEVIIDIGKKVIDAINQKVHDAMINQTNQRQHHDNNQEGGKIIDVETTTDGELSGILSELDNNDVNNDINDDDDLDVFSASPPQSVFIQLQPSVKRYTLLRDEL